MRAKGDSPAAKKKTTVPAADAGDADSPMAAAPKPKPALGGGPKGGGGPKIYTCYMCGQGFSGSSLGIHQPKCQQKWLAEQAAKPAGSGTNLQLLTLWYFVAKQWHPRCQLSSSYVFAYSPVFFHSKSDIFSTQRLSCKAKLTAGALLGCANVATLPLEEEEACKPWR